jgi:hypothetical protein
MALTENEKAKIIEMVTLATSTSNMQLIDSIKEQTEINTKLFNEMKLQTSEMKLISAKVTNGMSSKIDKIKDDVNTIKLETADKSGSLNRIFTKMNYQ